MIFLTIGVFNIIVGHFGPTMKMLIFFWEKLDKKRQISMAAIVSNILILTQIN